MCVSAQHLQHAWQHTDGNEWKQRCFLEPSKSNWKFPPAYNGSGSHSKGGNALLTTQARRSLKDYTADCQRGVLSSGLRNRRIRVQGLGVSCPTRDKTATWYINHRGGCVHTKSAEKRGQPRHFIYSASSFEGLHHKLREQQENNTLPLFVNICSKQLSVQ